jgi:hypothetical protein
VWRDVINCVRSTDVSDASLALDIFGDLPRLWRSTRESEGGGLADSELGASIHAEIPTNMSAALLTPTML